MTEHGSTVQRAILPLTILVFRKLFERASQMKNLRINGMSMAGFKKSMHLAGAAMIALTLAACQTPQQEMYADQDTCANMGARFGSSAHTSCMLQQQQRRDQAHLLFLEEARINSELARNAQEMRDRNRSN